MKLLCLRGVSGSGKSTYARELKAQGWVVVSRDDIRETMFKDYVSVNEDVVTAVQDAAIAAALKAGLNCCVDDTNIRIKYLKRFAKIAFEHNADFDVKQFDIDVNLACNRVLARAINGGRDVPEEVIKKQAQGLKSSKLNLAELYEVEVNRLYEPRLGTPKAIIVDLDGTLAHNNGHRGWYDYDKVGDDELVEVIADIVWMYAERDVHIIVMSGRDDSCQEATERWLEKHGVPFDEIHMRATGDQRKDSIVKIELFDEHVRDRYDVICCLDDRSSVVQAWRDIGLVCLQVAPGNF